MNRYIIRYKLGEERMMTIMHSNTPEMAESYLRESEVVKNNSRGRRLTILSVVLLG